MNQAIVFTSTKRDADQLAVSLQAQGHAAAALHGDMNQYNRTRTLSGMKQGRIRVLVATDVAARGLDVAGVSHVINYDLPRAPENYVHRIGRTGRAGAKGLALSFAHRAERGLLARIEGFTGQRIAPHIVPGFEPRQRHDATSRGSAARPSNGRGADQRGRTEGRYRGSTARSGDQPRRSTSR